MPVIRRATRVTRTTATAIDHIITDAILESTIHSGITKANISDHFPIFIILENSFSKNKSDEKTKITKQDFNNENIQNFQFFNFSIFQFPIYISKIFSDLNAVSFPKKELKPKSST